MVVVIGETGSGVLALELHCLQPAMRRCPQPAACSVAEPCCSTSCAQCKMPHVRPLQRAPGDPGGAGALKVYGLQPAACVCSQLAYRLREACAGIYAGTRRSARVADLRWHLDAFLLAACALEVLFPI